MQNNYPPKKTPAPKKSPAPKTKEDAAKALKQHMLSMKKPKKGC